MDEAKRVASNTGVLYAKMILSMVISLYSTRIILKALGVDDFGIFNLVAGVIGMLSFLNSAMALSTQRYLSYYIGAKALDMLKKVFYSSIILHLIIGVSVVLILEFAGYFLFQGGLNIPESRVQTAKIVFQFMIVSTFFTINAVPYDATILAHENMLFDSVVGVVEVLGKLLIAILIVNTNYDKLIFYGLMIALLTIVIRIVKSVYCISKYGECRYRANSVFDKVLLKEMFSFAGWNVFVSLCNVLRDQGIAVVMNVYFGVVINAAIGIANQVNGQLSSFSANINKALKPQIMKSEGGGDRKRMLKLAMLTCKLSFILLAFFAVPLILEMPYVFDLWLGKAPDNSVIFCRLILIISLMQQFTWGIGIAIQSVGKIKKYQIVTGSLLILTLPIAVIILEFELSAYWVYIASIIIEVIVGVITVYYAHKLANLDRMLFLKNTVLYSLIAVGISLFLASLPTVFFPQSLFRLLLTGGISSLCIISIGWILVFNQEEKARMIKLINPLLSKIKLK